MAAWTKRLTQDARLGAVGSLLLHLAVLLAGLWYLAHRPALTQTDLHVLPVELVLGGAMGQSGPGAATASLKIEKPHPESAPTPEGTSPKGIQQPQDELAAKLRALARLKTPDIPLANADNSAAPGGGDGTDTEGNTALKDFIRAQILRRWLPDLSIPGARNLPVLVRLRLLKNGVIADVDIVDKARMQTDAPFRNMAFSARDAALLASPIVLPQGALRQAAWLTITLDPKAVLR